MAAAQSLHVSQSAISQSLQKLESEIQTSLFTRLHKRLVPTAAGENLFAVVQPFMSDLDSCLKHIEQSRDRPFGKLRIGTAVEFGKAYFPKILAGFRELYPEVTFYLKLGDAGTLLPMLETGQIDLALVDEYLTQSQVFTNLDLFHFNAVAKEEVILACSSRYYSEQIRQDHSFRNLAAQEFITYRNSAQSVKNWFRHHFDKTHIDLRVVLTVDSQQAIIASILHHTGMGVVATHLVEEELESGLMVPINTSEPKIINQMSLVLLQDKILTLTEKTFQQFLLKQIKSIIL